MRQGAPEGLVSCHRNDTLIPTGRSGNRDAQVFTRNYYHFIIATITNKISHGSHTEWRRLHTIKFRVVIPATRIAWRNQRGNPSVNRRRTDNTMAKRKTTKGQTTVQNPTHKTKDRVTRTPPKTGGELRRSDVKRCSILLCPFYL